MKTVNGNLEIFSVINPNRLYWLWQSTVYPKDNWRNSNGSQHKSTIIQKKHPKSLTEKIQT
jgi:hypothetical protein